MKKNAKTEGFIMIFHPQNTVDTEGCFTFFGNATATAINAVAALIEGGAAA